MNNKKIILPLFLFGVLYSESHNSNAEQDKNMCLSKAMFCFEGVGKLLTTFDSKNETVATQTDEMNYSDNFNFQFKTPKGETINYAKYKEKDSHIAVYRVLVQPIKGKSKNYMFAMADDASVYELFLPSKKVLSETLSTQTYQAVKQKLTDIVDSLTSLVECAKELAVKEQKNPYGKDVLQLKNEMIDYHEVIFDELKIVEQLVNPQQSKTILKGCKTVHQWQNELYR
ncbi:MAG: hypothetical protein IJO11_01985 [Alphaproteobacteria bacterium]|nr:hypothetical protein [Alphaproteobacteria bacterium]